MGASITGRSAPAKGVRGKSQAPFDARASARHSGAVERPEPGMTEERLSPAEDAGRVDLDARAHGRGDGDALDVGALGARRLGLGDCVREGADVLDQLALVEGGLADAGMDNA